jgi:hypothetical protein
MLQMCAELGFRAQDIGSDIRRVVLELGNSAAQPPFPDAAPPPHVAGLQSRGSLRPERVR